MNKYQHTLKKLENNTAKRSIALVIEGALIGVLAGLTAVLYRYCLTYAESGLYAVLNFIRGNAVVTALWFAALILMGCIVAKIAKWEPMAAGSGIPQVSGEVRGYLDQSFWRVILAKFTGGTLSIFGGLSLGREGPSIQLGAMVAKSYSRLRNYDKTTEIGLLSCVGRRSDCHGVRRLRRKNIFWTVCYFFVYDIDSCTPLLLAVSIAWYFAWSCGCRI